MLELSPVRENQMRTAFFPLIRGAIITAFFVGSVLLLINQFESVFRGGEINLIKATLSYCVPFFVYIWGSMASKLKNVDTEVVINEGQSNTCKAYDEEISEKFHALDELGNQVREIASRVNKASKGRLEVAQKTLENSALVIATANHIDEISQETVQSVTHLSSETDSVLADMERLISTLKSSAHWASQMSANIGNFSENFNSINSIAVSIAQISHQTKLLAINAAIEAARAGDSGRGFSVVATHVKELSDNTEVQTREITQILSKLEANVHSLKDETNEYSKRLVSSLNQVSKGEDGTKRLSAEMSGIIYAVSELIRNSQEQTQVLRDYMHATKTGMEILIEGTKSAVDGSAMNIKIGTDILSYSQDLFGLYKTQ